MNTHSEDDSSFGRESSEVPFLPPIHKTQTVLPSSQSTRKGASHTALLRTIVALLFTLIALQSVFEWRSSRCSCEPTEGPHSQSSHGPKHPVPQFRTYTQEFYNATSDYGIWKVPWTEEEWMRWYGNWEALYPPGRGMVKIMDPEQYPDIPPPMDDFVGKEPPADGGYRYELAITHQLHCLWVMQRYFYEIQAGLRRGDHWSTFFHINHCTDYLRWTLLCHADTTLEGWDEEQLHNPNAHPRHRGPSGLHTPHQCTDYKQVYGWMEENRWYDLKSMDNDVPENSTYQDWTKIWERTRKWMSSSG